MSYRQARLRQLNDWSLCGARWCSSGPSEAYRTLEHLNNNCALDGRDPDCYTGILWRFGLFDRPGPPERKILGAVRYMSSEKHGPQVRPQAVPRGRRAAAEHRRGPLRPLAGWATIADGEVTGWANVRVRL